MRKLNGESLNITEENLKALEQLFPEAFEEGKIDFAVLKQILGDFVDDEEERYSFKWNGKGRALRLSQTPSLGTLRPCKEESKDWDTTQNLYIEGDNLEVLKLLQKSYYGKVKMIYIDPPYNTGGDFVYKDDFRDNIENYKRVTGQIDGEGHKIDTNTESNGRFHTDWLNMMYPRLRLARNLLSEDGVIFISIDDNEQENLKRICNEILGESNFVGCLILQTATDNNLHQINTEHEYVICYAKNKSILEPWFADSEKALAIQDCYESLKVKYGNDIATIQKELRTWIKKNKESLKGVSHYDNVDKKGVFHDGDVANTVFGGYRYNVIHPVTKKICKIPDKGYRFSEDTMRKMISENDIMFGEDETILIKPKKRIENAKDILRSVIYEDGRTSTKQFESLMGRDIFQNPKSPMVLERIINFVAKKGGIIMDFFSGSGTTAEAVIRLNAKKNYGLKYVMIQIPENLDVMLNNVDSRNKKTIQNAIDFLDELGNKHSICEIGKERIRRAGKKIRDELLRHSLHTTDSKGLNPQDSVIKAEATDKEKVRDLDIGFKVFKLDSSNLKKWNPHPEDLQLSLQESVSNFLPGRSQLDVVYEILLKLGLDLTFPIEERKAGNETVYIIAGGALMICLGEKITLPVAEEIAKLHKEYDSELWQVVFRDTGFASDMDKTNIKETLKTAGLDEDSFVCV